MLFRKLNKLYRLKARLHQYLAMAKNSGADPDVIAIRISDIEYDIDKVQNKIEFEKRMKPLIYMLWGFMLFSILILTLLIISIYL
jgi:hypothetical protein